VSLRDRIVAVLAQAQAAGSLVVSVEAVERAIAAYDTEQKALTLRALERIRPEVVR
jgi:hypothetical protein